MKNSQNELTTKTYTINTMEDAMSYLSNSVNQVSYDVNNINLQVDDVQSQVNDMKNNVKSLENEVRVFMQEMKKNVMINDAKQTIMMTQIEYDKKYKYRDDVRRRIVGLLQSVDINVIKKSTMETISEETIIKWRRWGFLRPKSAMSLPSTSFRRSFLPRFPACLPISSAAEKPRLSLIRSPGPCRNFCG